MRMSMELLTEDGKRSYQQLASSRSIVHMYIHFPSSFPLLSASFQKPGGFGTVQLRDSCKGHWALSRGACDRCKGKSYHLVIIGYTLRMHTQSVHIEKLLADIIFFIYLKGKISFKRESRFYSFSFFRTLP